MYKYFFYNLFKNKLSFILFSIRDLTITFIYNKIYQKKIMILILIYFNNAINIIIILLKFYI